MDVQVAMKGEEIIERARPSFRAPAGRPGIQKFYKSVDQQLPARLKEKHLSGKLRTMI
jgi:hypothetical protein